MNLCASIVSFGYGTLLSFALSETSCHGRLEPNFAEVTQRFAYKNIWILGLFRRKSDDDNNDYFEGNPNKKLRKFND